MSNADRSLGTWGRLRWAGLAALVAALGLCLMPGVADAKKKKKKKPEPVKVMTQNLYVGADVDPIVRQALLSRPDGLADAAGTAVDNINANDFPTRAKAIAKFIKKNKVDVVGLQEAERLLLGIPSDGGGPGGFNPHAQPANTVLVDFLDVLLGQLNKKALSKKECRKLHEKHPGKQCYRGYSLAGAQQESDNEEPADTDHNNGPDGQTFDITTTTGVADFGKWLLGNDDTTTGVPLGEPPSPPFPPDANFDTSDTGQTPDPVSPITGAPGEDCNDALQQLLVDNNPAAGPAFGDATSGGPWPFQGFDRDTDPLFTGVQTPVCLFHGLEADARLVDRDALIVRKGAGVKASNVQGSLYAPQNQLTVSVFGGAASVGITRGWIAADLNVRGKKFHLVNTHLAAENQGSFREDQASELVGAGGAAAQPNTILVGDLNSDPSIQPGSDPNADSSSNIAYNRIAAAGFSPLTAAVPTDGHAEILNNPGDNSLTKRIDWILTNNPSITMKSSSLLNQFANGLWTSDHAGVLSVLNVPGGKKK